MNTLGMIEIKLIGTGGQGAVVAGKLLAEAAVEGGYEAQAFASYGYARRGGTVASFVRISKEKIRLHSEIYQPDYIVLMSEDFARNPKAVSDLKEGGTLLINSPYRSENFSSLGNFRILTIDADRVAVDAGLKLPSGMPIINTAILGAVEGMISLVGFHNLAEAIKNVGIPNPEKNVKAAQEAYQMVKSQAAGATIAKVRKEEISEVSVERYPKYQVKMSPCEANCPAGCAIRETISLIQRKQFEEAVECIKSENPFPGMCGRVCFHPCEEHCNRSEYDEGVAINALERATFDYVNMNMVRKPTKKERTGRRVAIIGSGPAGMTGAYFLAMLGHEVTVFEALPVPGGIPRVGIPRYRLPKDVVDKEIGQVVELGVNLRPNTEVGKDVSFQDITRRFDACLIATGAHRSMRLNIPGEDTKGVISGLELLKAVALEKQLDIGAKVAVIGGGNTAVDAARTVKRLGAQEVSIIYRRSAQEMPAHTEGVGEAKKEGITILYLAMPVQIYSEGHRVNNLECVETRLGRKDKSGRRRPQKVEGTNFVLNVDTVIVATGETVEVSFLPAAIERDGSLIKIDRLGRTSMAGVYAAGDVTTLSRSVVEAIASGKRAALGIDIFFKGAEERILAAVQRGQTNVISMGKYLAENHNRYAEDSSLVSFADLNVGYFSRSPRAQVSKPTRTTGALNFDEVNLGLSRDEAIQEARRCFQCGLCNLCENCYILCPDVAITFDEKMFSFTVNHDLCKRCGICAEECPRNVITC